MSLLDEFPHKCSILKNVEVEGSQGSTYDKLHAVQTDVECWQQQASASETAEYEKEGISVSSKIYFLSDPGITRQHKIQITERFGVAVTERDLDVLSSPKPDSSAGLGVLWKVMVGENTGDDD